jgi:hypothetical protein
MRKTAAETPTADRKGSPPRGHWVRGSDSEPAEPAARNALRRTKKASFIEPDRLSETARAALLARLSELKLGDQDSRELFAAAVEYAVASSRSAVTEAPAPAAPTPPAVVTSRPAVPAGPLQELAQTAALLAERLSRLDAQTREALLTQLQQSDLFARAHDQAYLETVAREIRRIGEASAAVSQAQPAVATTKASRPDASRAQAAKRAARLVQRVADAYESCFETRVTEVTGELFVPVIRMIGAEAGIELSPEDAELMALLRGR